MAFQRNSPAMSTRIRSYTIGLLLIVLSTGFAELSLAGNMRVVDTIEVDKVPSWFPVGFCLLTHEERQYLSYYNAQHQMVVASRNLSEREWQKVELPSKIGWDSHNYITMAVDSAGQLHLAGNMHCVPLIYFRTRSPGDITTFERTNMTGHLEKRCTYPRFLTDSEGKLLFMYRSGGSGNGSRLINHYDAATQTWSRFIDGPLFEGEGKRNAYPLGPVKGPDGLFHMIWVWRDTPDCATNHTLSYVRSRDLRRWETAAGRPVTLPLTLEQKELCIDPVPSHGGIINGCEKLTFDSDQRPIVSYHKQDANGHMQIYVARFQRGQWRRHAVTSWDKRIDFSGGGAMPFIGIRVGSLRQHPTGPLVISYRHRDYGSGQITLDEDTLEPIDRKLTFPRVHPRTLSRVNSKFPHMSVRLATDIGRSPAPKTEYVLRWEALPAHHDRPRQPPLPPASTLTLVKLEEE